MMNLDAIEVLITNIKLLCVTTFVVASSSSAATAQDKDIFHECGFEKSISESYLNWQRYPKMACEKYKENCDLVDEIEKGNWPKYKSTEQIENICKAKVQSHIDDGMEFDTIVANLERANLSCVERSESVATSIGKKRLVSCSYTTSYVMPKALALEFGFERSVGISIAFGTTIVEELNDELNVSTNFSSMFP